MKNYQCTGTFRTPWRCIGQLLVLCLSLCSFTAEATAPRITPKLFGEEVKADILKYRLSPSKSAIKAEDELLLDIVTAAFSAAGKNPVLDVQPSQQLAKYALFNNEVVALIGSPQDLSAKEKKNFRFVTFYLRGAASDGAPVVMIFGRKAGRGDELYQAFKTGLQTILKSGAYREILEKYHGSGKLPADYVGRLNQLNSVLQ